eukprot:TRINITY_DN3463_c0_g1_i1.p2 TRINITY_DN3463_c0_g1~~TRINITY_DN3463_c0_g1_i1.p2  ORF type:complete len:105 (-),score=17.72 TRINITY_DN3463_c0_g1_i1:198-512(-)
MALFSCVFAPAPKGRRRRADSPSARWTALREKGRCACTGAMLLGRSWSAWSTVSAQREYVCDNWTRLQLGMIHCCIVFIENTAIHCVEVELERVDTDSHTVGVL